MSGEFFRAGISLATWAMDGRVNPCKEVVLEFWLVLVNMEGRAEDCCCWKIGRLLPPADIAVSCDELDESLPDELAR